MIINLRLGYNTLFLNGKWHKLVQFGEEPNQCNFSGSQLSLFHITNNCPQIQPARSLYLTNFNLFDNDITTYENQNLHDKLVLRKAFKFLVVAMEMYA